MSDYPPGRPRPSDENEPPSTSGSPAPPPSGQDWGSPPPGPPGEEPRPGGAPPPPPPGQDWGSAPPPPPPPPGQGWGAPPPPPGGPGYGGPGGPGGYSGYGPGGYSVGNAFRYAFDKFRANLAPLLLITLGILVAVGVLQIIGSEVTNGMVAGARGAGWFGAASIVSLLFSALSLVVQLVIEAGIVKASLDLTRGQPVTAGNAFSGIDWAQVVLTALVIGVLTFIGLILCVLPGIAVVFLTSFALYFVIDRNMPAIDAIRASVSMVARNFGQLILFFLATLAAYIIGACLCGVGLLAAIPIVVIAQAYTFRTLNDDPVTA